MTNQGGNQSYHPVNSGQPAAGKKNGYQKGLGFIPNSICKSDNDPISRLLKAAPTLSMGQFTSTLEGNAIYDSDATIPLFDIEKISLAQGTERKELVQTFGTAIKQVGFLGIKAFKLKQLINSVYGEMKRYFHQPFEIKLANWQKLELQRGFSFRGSETGPMAPRPDFKESFFITADFTEWPSRLPSFAKTMGQYFSILQDVNHYLTLFLMEYLDHLEAVHPQPANHTLRLAYYPSLKCGDDPKGTWSAPQRDKNVISICSNGTVPGLQYYSRKGYWEPVIVPEGYLIVNTGMLLQHKTAGFIQARWHRVVNPGGKYTRLERLATTFYGTWPEEYSLKPFENCASAVTKGMPFKRAEEYLKKYPDVFVADKLCNKSTLLTSN